MAIEIIPSILSADFARLAADVQAVSDAGATKVQVDVMDGHFVPNLTVGLPVVRALKQATDVALDVHLMIERPERYIDAFVDAGADVLTVHVEAVDHLHGVLQHIRDRGAQCGAALNPATPLVALEEVLGDLDVALVMTINPGFGGQTLIPSTVPKIARLRAMIEDGGHRATIQVDGGINAATARVVVAAGASQLVAGSAVFSAGVSPAEAMAALQHAASTSEPR